MDQFGEIIWDAATRLFTCTNDQAAYIYNLDENLELLKQKWSDLQNKEKDLQIDIQKAESTGVEKRTNEVIGWLQNVRILEEEMKHIPESEEIRNNQCLSGYCPKNCISSYKLGKKIVQMLTKVDNLLAKVDKIKITHKPPPNLVNEMPTGETVGLDLMVEKVWKMSIEGDSVGIVGLYGMGGAGKTTLMKRIHNEFGKRKNDFDIVLWTEVSRDCDNDKIMSNICNRLGIDDDITKETSDIIGPPIPYNPEQRATKIYQVLKEKKFVLMLDDLWGELKLEKVGIPIPKETKNKSKVIFTTRYKNVCDKMQAQKKFKVECLREKEAFDLFSKKVGDETLKCHREIPKLAQEMAKKCGGLPLALITLGTAMVGVKSVKAWRKAKKDLSRKVDSNLSEVFPILKFSYDKLPDEAHKKCFLYCALYPEDYEVCVEDLIYRWIGEGFIGNNDNKSSIYDTFEQGETIIEKLRLSCLLEESVVDDWRDWVKMHDVIRDMALWLARDQNENKDKIVVQEEAFAMSEINNSQRLNAVNCISVITGSKESISKFELIKTAVNIKATQWNLDRLMQGTYTSSEINSEEWDYITKETSEFIGPTKSWQVPACSNLITLCVRFERQIPEQYICSFNSNLKSMKTLKVLDLSGNYFLKRVPSEIGELINLEFLNLSRTIFFFGLPIEMKKLIKLRVFLMEDVLNDRGVIPLEVIESLTGLKVFRISTHKSELDKTTPLGNVKKEMKILEKLESLPNLEELCIQLTTISNVNKLLSSTKLRGCSRHIKICFYGNKEDYSLEMPSLLESWSKIKQLLDSIHLQGINNLIEEEGSISINDRCYLGMLRHVNIDKCDSITHLTWLRHAPFLEYLKVSNCASIKHVVKEAEDEEVGSYFNDIIFQNLTHIYLLSLPKLESIHKTALTFPFLKHIIVSNCPNLRKLPFNSTFLAHNNLISIQGQTAWWNKLEWENKDPTFQHLLHSKFQPKFQPAPYLVRRQIRKLPFNSSFAANDNFNPWRRLVEQLRVGK